MAKTGSTSLDITYIPSLSTLLPLFPPFLIFYLFLILFSLIILPYNAVAAEEILAFVTSLRSTHCREFAKSYVRPWFKGDGDAFVSKSSVSLQTMDADSRTFADAQSVKFSSGIYIMQNTMVWGGGEMASRGKK